MIRVIYNNPQLCAHWRIAWTFIVFFAINYLVLVAFINFWFQNLGLKQPVPFLTSLVILLIDLIFKIQMTKKIFTIGNLMDLLIILSFIVSIALFNKFHNIVFIEILAVFKLKDIRYLNKMVYHLVKKSGIIFKIYVILKVTYCIIFFGMIIGCIFYGMDNYLIKSQYFGTIQTNPRYYYQGAQRAFTPIYYISEQQRFVYALYYSFSLISTCSFGDIIGHNYFEDIIVCIIMLFSTIFTSVIIQQMYIVFRREKSLHYELTNKIKNVVSQYIKAHSNINNQFRHQLINYMIHTQWQQINLVPNLKQLTNKLHKSLFTQSILHKSQNQLPLIIKSYFLPILKSRYYPSNYYLIDYNRLQNHIDGRIILNSKVNVGYTKQLIGKRTFSASNIIFGFEQLIINTNYIQKYLTVQLVEQAQVFVLNQDEFFNKMSQLKEKMDQYLLTPIQIFQISKDQIIGNLEQRNYCYECNQKGHTLVDCPSFHYNTRTIKKFYLYSKFYSHERQQYKRRKLRSNKNTSMKSLQQLKRQKSSQPNLGTNFSTINKLSNQNNLFQNLLQKVILNQTEEKIMDVNDPVDSYYIWKIYAPGAKI